MKLIKFGKYDGFAMIEPSQDRYDDHIIYFFDGRETVRYYVGTDKKAVKRARKFFKKVAKEVSKLKWD